MQINRRITNGLAWAGAALVIGIPVLDFALRQVAPESPRAVAIAPAETEESAAVQQPDRAESVAAPQVAETPRTAPDPTSPPATEAAAPSGAASGDAVDQFVQSGRPLPSYISDGGAASAPTPAPAPAAPPAAQTAPATQTQPAAQTATPAPTPAPTRPAIETPVAAAPKVVNVTLPTPVSQRPPSRPTGGPVSEPPVIATVPPAPVQTLPPAQPGPIAQPVTPVRPPLVVDDYEPVITAEDLEDWESGPLSDFLANRARQRGQQAPVGDFAPEGFFLDEYYSSFGQ